jgi:hypothetical protein
MQGSGRSCYLLDPVNVDSTYLFLARRCLQAERLFLISFCCLGIAARSHFSVLARLLQGSEGDVFKVAALDKSGKWREFAAKVEKMLPDGTYRDNLKGEVKDPKSAY